MNDLYKTINSHRSIRSYLKKDIPEEVMTRILNAALRASSSGNMQAYSIIVTTDAVLKQQLLAPHFNQGMVTEAPALLTFCADFHRMRQWLELSEAPANFDNFMSFMIASIDATLASQNAALAAESEGLGVCYLGTTLASCDRIAKVLKCPDNVVPVVGFTMGYPAETPALRDRLPLSAVAHRQTYQEKSDDEMLQVYREREVKGFQRYHQVPELKKLIEETQSKNLAQVYTKAKYTRESHLHYSQTVLNFLEENNFMNNQR